MKNLILLVSLIFTQNSYSMQCSELLLSLTESAKFTDVYVQRAYEGDLGAINMLLKLKNKKALYKMSHLEGMEFSEEITYKRLINVVFMKNIERRKPKAIKRLLGSDYIELNSGEYGSLPPLFWAIKSQNSDIVHMLLDDSRLDTNMENIRGMSALAYAVFLGKTSIVKDLLNSEKFEVNQSSKFEPHPLTVAIKANNFALFYALLKDPRTNPSGLMGSSTTPLIEALKKSEDQYFIALESRHDLNLNVRTSSNETAANYYETRGRVPRFRSSLDSQ